jgi:hypothetical protein
MKKASRRPETPDSKRCVRGKGLSDSQNRTRYRRPKTRVRSRRDRLKIVIEAIMFWIALWIASHGEVNIYINEIHIGR